MWEWVLRSGIFDSWSSQWNRDFPNFPYFCICGSSGWVSVKRRPWKVGYYPKIGNWSVSVLLGWRFVFGIIMKCDGREPHIVRYHHDSRNNKAASLLRLMRLNKLSSTKDYLNTQTCKGMLCVSALSPHNILQSH